MTNLKEGIAYPSITYKINTLCGTMNTVKIMHPETKQIVMVQLYGGKPGTCASTQNSTICALLTSFINLKKSEKIRILNSVIGAKCNSQESCSSFAMRIVLEHILNEKEEANG